MPHKNKTRTYNREESAVFKKTKEKHGGLSNMASGFPLVINDIEIRTSEALYQACRFPDLPDVQEKIIAERSPMTAKMRSKPHRKYTRSDWKTGKSLNGLVCVKIMRWCLRAKLLQNWNSFSALLEETGTAEIVEESRKDSFWGAIPIKDTDDLLEGQNILGRLLMELRHELREKPESLEFLAPLDIDNFSLYGKPIRAIHRIKNIPQPKASGVDNSKKEKGKEKQLALIT